MKKVVSLTVALSVVGIGGAIFVRPETLPGGFADFLGTVEKESPPDIQNDAVAKRISRMSVEEKIGQMLMVSIPGATLSEETASWLRTRHIGGVILLGNNVTDREQAVAFITDLQSLGRTADSPKLFIAADQEGGTISRFRFLDAMDAQSEITDEASAYAVALERGKELRALGVTVNFSPVLDVSSSPEDFIYSRAFRGDAATVAALGGAMIRGYRDGGVIVVAKHFPGHGGTPVDSHRNLPIVSRSDEQWRTHLTPFAKAIEERVPMIMSAHITIPGKDEVNPATLSRAIITDVLRGELGYEGVVITDDLGMGAITSDTTLADAAVRAVEAGADILLLVRNIADYGVIYSALLKKTADGVISENRLDRSVSRILKLKEAHLAP